MFGADAQVTVIATADGVLGLRGAVVDGRSNYRHADGQAPTEQAAASLLAHASERSGVAAASLTVDALRLVAVPRAAAIGWMALVSRGAELVAVAVVEADPTQSEHLPRLPLLYYWDGHANGLHDEVPVDVHAERLSSDVFHDPIEAAMQDALYDGSPLLGSQTNVAFQLATDRVAAVEASALEMLGGPTAPVQFDSTSFVAAPGSPMFRAHSWYVLLANLYAYTDSFLAGAWESTRPVYQGKPSLYPPGGFRPRIVLHANAPESACRDGEIFCYASMTPKGKTDGVPDIYEHPLGTADYTYEPVGGINIESSTGFATILHEFGHAIDDFVKPGLLDLGLACTGDQDCLPSCEEDSTDEATPLMETWAQIASIWLARGLVPDADMASNCDVLVAVSRGSNRSPHHPACRPDDSSRSVLLRTDDPDCPPEHFCIPSEPDCTQEDVCDKPHEPGYDAQQRPTGQCRGNRGYRTDSVFQAIWEILHAESCADAGDACTAMTSFGQGPHDRRGGEALLYALRVGSATYRGFADDIATHVACNHGAAAYAEVNEVLCHHRLRDCDAPVPVICPLCGDGRREGVEVCDGDDLGDSSSCQTLGYAVGSLACAADCVFDLADCASPGATSGAQDGGDVPTLGDEGASAAPDAGTGDSEGFGGAGVADAYDGCGCRPREHRGASWLALGLGGLLANRRRRAMRSAATTLSAALALLCGCTARIPPDDETADAASASSGTEETAESSSTGDGPELDPRFFDWFHSDPVGDVNDGSYLHFWSNLELRPDGKLVRHGAVCTNASEPEELTWKLGAEPNTLEVQPNAGEFIDIAGHSWTSMHLSLTPGCGRLAIAYTNSDGVYRTTYDRGRVCAQGSECEYEIVWCDARPMTTCTED